MATFLTDMIEKRYTQDKVFAVVFESEREKKRREMLAIVTKTVDGHRLQKMRDLLAFENLATWRRMNGFDRVVEGEENWFHGHRLLPLTPEQYTFFFFFLSLISLIADGPHHYYPACGQKGSSHLSPVHALQFFIAMQVHHSYNSLTNG